MADSYVRKFSAVRHLRSVALLGKPELDHRSITTPAQAGFEKCGLARLRGFEG